VVPHSPDRAQAVNMRHADVHQNQLWNGFKG
jgi:hypothetical protein